MKQEEQNPVVYENPDQEIVLSFSLMNLYKDVIEFHTEYALCFAAATKQFHTLMNPTDHHKPPALNISSILLPIKSKITDAHEELLLRLMKQRLSLWVSNQLIDNSLMETMIQLIYQHATKTMDRIYQAEFMDFFLLPSTTSTAQVFPNILFLSLPDTSFPQSLPTSFPTYLPTLLTQSPISTCPPMGSGIGGPWLVVAVFSCSLELPVHSIDKHTRYALQLDQQLEKPDHTSSMNQEQRYLDALVEILLRSGVQLVCGQQRIAPYLRTRLAQYGIVCISNISIHKIAHVICLSGSRLFSELTSQFVFTIGQQIPLETLGILSCLAIETILGQKYLKMIGFASGQTMYSTVTEALEIQCNQRNCSTPLAAAYCTNPKQTLSKLQIIQHRIIPRYTVCLTGASKLLRQRLQDGWKDTWLFYQTLLKEYFIANNGNNEDDDQEEAAYSLPSKSFLYQKVKYIDTSQLTNYIQRGYRFTYDDDSESDSGSSSDSDEEEYVPVIFEIVQDAIGLAERECRRVRSITQIVAVN